MKNYFATEIRVQRIRDTPAPSDLVLGDTPEKIAEYARQFICTSDRYNSDVENFCVVYLNTRRRVTGYSVVSNGTLDTLLVHPREVFKGAFLMNAAAIVVLHNHPSGDSTPSEADIKVTKDLMRAGQLLKLEVLDHVILGVADKERPRFFTSLRELGYFYS